MSFQPPPPPRRPSGGSPDQPQPRPSQPTFPPPPGRISLPAPPGGGPVPLSASPHHSPSAIVFTGETVAPRRVVSSGGPPGARPAATITSPGDWFREKLREQIERSPPLTVSLILHIVVILALALFIIHQPASDEPIIELSFATFTETVREEKGVEIKPSPEPVEEPEPVEVKSEKPPVVEAAAAPPEAREEPVETVGPATSQVAAPAIGTLLNGREEGRREALVKAFGGSSETEAAVARALAWLAKQQDKKTGLWSLKGPYSDGSSYENHVAATAMALLAFQGAGNTTMAGKHSATVERGWKALLAAQQPDGRFEAGTMPARQGLYSHGQATVALCELYGMTQAKQYSEPAQRAVAYCVASQGPGGGWRYEPGKDGDMSVTGWFMMALKSAEMAYVPVPPATLERLVRFVDRVAVENGARYGYRSEKPENPAAPVTDAVSAEGLLCRQYSGWKRDDPRLVSGVELLLEGSPIDFKEQTNAYAWYYITQVAHNLGGTAWDRWNDRMKEALPAAQRRSGRDSGSWDPTGDRWGGFGGRLYMTCFCTYMLEVYYRHLPLYEAVNLE